MIKKRHTNRIKYHISQYSVKEIVRSISFSATSILLIGGFMLLSSVVGCGGQSRGPVDGKVTLNGQPLEYGVISFRPVKGNASPGSGGVIIDGSFKIPGDKGLKPGEYKVNIEVLQRTGRMIRDFPGGPEKPERVPVQINEAGQLEATVGGEEVHFEFALTTKLI